MGVLQITNRTANRVPVATTALVVAIVCNVPLQALGQATHSTILSVAGIALLGTLAQETWRIECASKSRFNISFAGSAIAFSTAVVLCATLSITDLDDRGLASWAGVAIIQIVTGAIFANRWKLLTSVHEFTAFWKNHSKSIAELAVSYAATTIPWVLTPTVLTTTSGVAAAGALRGAQTLAAMPQQLPQGLQQYVLRRWTDEQESAGARHLAVAWGGAMIALFAPCIFAMAIMPDRLGVVLLGSTWDSAGTIAPVIMAAAMIASFNLGQDQLLRARRRFRGAANARTLGAALQVALIFVGAGWFGLHGAAFATIAGQVITAALLARHLR